ncbi:MAG: hypothetical protein B6U85_02820 [Desulfurococcales archaeon ex4484_42]|nr:MAG: hypothetical protein B6U85_02820 [Desulfurococcales archaeon ex4484_42]
MLIIEGKVKSIGIYAALTICRNVIVKQDNYVKSLLENLVKEVMRSHGIEQLKDHPLVRAYRDTMWRLGIDPTKIRPSSEALLRRILRKSYLPSINNIVDACNIASARNIVVISVIDLDKVSPPLILRFAKNGEEFIDLSGKVRILKDYEIVLSDSKGIIIHLYPYRDSARSAISSSTRNVIAVAYGAEGIPKHRLLDALKEFADIVLRSVPNAKCEKPVLIL